MSPTQKNSLLLSSDNYRVKFGIIFLNSGQDWLSLFLAVWVSPRICSSKKRAIAIRLYSFLLGPSSLFHFECFSSWPKVEIRPWICTTALLAWKAFFCDWLNKSHVWAFTVGYLFLTLYFIFLLTFHFCLFIFEKNKFLWEEVLKNNFLKNIT